VDIGFLQYFAVCALVGVAGFVDSIAGGGGLISLPAYLAFGLPPHAALATNKFSSACGTFTAVVRYWRAGTVRVRIGLIAAAGALAGSAAGARAVLLVPAAVVHAILLVLVPAVLVFFLLRDRVPARVWPAVRPGTEAGREGAALGIGLAIGCYDGFFGPGTGTFLAIAFAAILGFDLLTASANARLANLASNVGSLVVFLWDGRVVFPLAIWAAAAGIAGNLLGSWIAVRRGERVIRPLMALVLVLLLIEVLRRHP